MFPEASYWGLGYWPRMGAPFLVGLPWLKGPLSQKRLVGGATSHSALQRWLVAKDPWGRGQKGPIASGREKLFAGDHTLRLPWGQAEPTSLLSPPSAPACFPTSSPVPPGSSHQHACANIPITRPASGKPQDCSKSFPSEKLFLERGQGATAGRGRN